ncbi:MAG: 6-pyruvoyl tetrahydropterin synthase family protein [Thermoplasmata archaeon]|nr:6-pyruvoyl tetrahydropterin synthase family protein [Thermoplasmata archaeon]
MEIRLDGWRSHLIFSSAHFLAEYSKCSRLHGHSYAVHVIIKGEPVDGIVIDFRKVKDTINKIIDSIDHRLIVPVSNDNVVVGEKEVEIINNGKRYVIPKEDCALLPIKSSSAESIAEYILDVAWEKLLQDNIYEIMIGVDEGYGQGAWAWRKR